MGLTPLQELSCGENICISAHKRINEIEKEKEWLLSIIKEVNYEEHYDLDELAKKVGHRPKEK